MPSVRDQSKLSQPSLLVYANISGMPAIALECLLLSPVLNCREVERMQKTQASSLDTGHLTRREGLPVHGRVCTRAHAHTHTHTHTLLPRLKAWAASDQQAHVQILTQLLAIWVVISHRLSPRFPMCNAHQCRHTPQNCCESEEQSHRKGPGSCMLAQTTGAAVAVTAAVMGNSPRATF